MSETRQRILAAALACFAEQGVASTTVEQIREVAGVSTGSLYHHFGDRQRLAASVHEWLLRDYQRGFVAELESDGDAATGIARAVRYHVGWCRDRPDAARYLLTEPTPSPTQPGGDVVAEVNRAFLRRVLAWLRPHVSYGVVRSLDVDMAYALWLGPAQERCRLWVTGRSSAPSKEETDVLAEAAVRCLVVSP